MRNKKPFTKHIIPEVNITCTACGVVAKPSGLFHRGIVRDLKQYCYRSGWVQDVETSECYCPECQKELKLEKWL